MKRKYGCRPDKIKPSDWLYRRISRPRLEPLSDIVDLRQQMPMIVDQGPLGSCVWNSLVGALEFLEIKSGQGEVDLSRLFGYYNTRALEGCVNEDGGCEIRDAVSSLSDKGVCSETLWPYDISRFTVQPDPIDYQEALNHKITSYHRLLGLNDMLSCLADGFPFVFGIDVFESFESDRPATTGIIPMPGRGEQNLGGHALCAVGYDRDKQWFIVRNSWGCNWGDKGYCYIPMQYLEQYGRDFWVIQQV